MFEKKTTKDNENDKKKIWKFRKLNELFVI